MTKNTDTVVMEMLEKVQAKKAEIEKALSIPRWRTNCSIDVTWSCLPNRDIKSSNRINLATITDTNVILDLFSLLTQRENDQKEVAKELNIKPNLNWQAYSIDDWKKDLKDRMAQITVEQKRKELEELDKRINKLVSPEQRREMELEAIKKLLGD